MLLTAIFLFSCVLVTKADDESYNDIASLQLPIYNETHTGTAQNLTNSNGAPINYQEASSGLNANLLRHQYFRDSISHFVTEIIPERVVHGKGAGAFGYFEVTDDVTNITKADFLNTIGKQTRVLARFSTAMTGRGGCDTNRELRGFAVKFYTAEGNFDMAGLSAPMFPLKDSKDLVSFIHSQKRNPRTNLPDTNAVWDFALYIVESIHTILWTFGYGGLPAGYRHLNGYSIHTLQTLNTDNEPHFVRLHFKPDAGDKYLNSTRAAELMSEDPDYATRDLYNAIENGDYPCWTLYFQHLTLDDLLNAEFDVCDVTKTLSEDDYPLKKVGKMCLNRNPDNYFADIEQAAFSPCNLVPGFSGAPDKMFEARCLAYNEAQLYRLGRNYHNIEVNYPYASNITNINRDGKAPVLANNGEAPNYYPSSLNRLQAYVESSNATVISITQEAPDNFNQTSELYESLSEDEKNSTIDVFVASLSTVTELLQQRVVELLTKINSDLANRVMEGLQETTTSK